MRDYTVTPGCEGLPNPTARARYLDQLLRLYQGPGSDQGICTRRLILGGCRPCNLRRCLNADAHKGVCGWAAEADPEWAILCLEELTSRDKEMNIFMREPERPIDPPEEKMHYCPICGEESPETIVLGIGHEPLGCEKCLTLKDACDYFEEQEEPE